MSKIPDLFLAFILARRDGHSLLASWALAICAAYIG